MSEVVDVVRNGIKPVIPLNEWSSCHYRKLIEKSASLTDARSWRRLSERTDCDCASLRHERFPRFWRKKLHTGHLIALRTAVGSKWCAI
jgi:hypothetical protein